MGGPRGPPRACRRSHPRLTLTVPVLNAARLAMFLVCGAAKREPLARMLGGDMTSPLRACGREEVLVHRDAGRRARVSRLAGDAADVQEGPTP